MVGRVLGERYRLVAPLGTGASAVVYVAEDVRLRRDVAVKVLHPALAADSAFLRRFQAEAQVAAGLRHPNLLAVHDWGEEHGTAYLVTEHLEGGSLRDLLDRGFRASPSQALLLGLQAARGLDHAHRRGLVHRDVKPANLLFDADGRLRVADFGLARAIAEAAVTEPMGALLGTARYASPEQAEGRPLDGRSDVYSLGLVLIEALTGRVPFTAETSAATLLARVGHAVAPPPEAGPLTDALMAVGRPKPVDRPNAAAFGRMLKGCASELPPPAPLPLARVASRAGQAAARPEDVTAMPPVRPPRPPGHLPAPKPMEPLPATRGAEAPPSPAHPEKVQPDDADGPVVVIDDDRPGALLAAERVEPEVDPPTRRHRRRRRAASGSGGTRRWRRRAVVLVVVLMLAGAGGAAALTKPWLDTVEVPNLRGLTLEEAAVRLKPSRLRVRVTSHDYSESVEAGSIISYEAKAKQESAVPVVLSDGPEPRTIKPARGLPIADVQRRLEEDGLRVEIIPKDDDAAPVGTVLDTDPAANLQAARGSTVKVTVSDGPPARPVPDVVGKPYDQAAAAVTAQGFAVTRSDAFNDTVPAGNVVSEAPAAATPLKPGKPVTLTVSKGPDLVTVPAVAGMAPGDAQAAMQGAGLSVSATYGPPAGKVFDTAPKQGTKVKRGTAVALYTR